MMIRKKLAAFVLIFALCASLISYASPTAGAASTTPTRQIVNEGIVGWENWRSENHKYDDTNYYMLYCPYKGATVDNIFFYINKLITENMGVLNERYGQSEYPFTSIHLMFDWPDFGEHPETSYHLFVKYLESVETFYDNKQIEFIALDRTPSSEKDKGISQIDIALTNNAYTDWSGSQYNPSTGAYEWTVVAFYDALDDIVEYKTFGSRTGNWVENQSTFMYWAVYDLRFANIARSHFEIYDAASFNRSILSQPYTTISNIYKTDGKYVLVKHLSVTAVEPAVRAKIQDLCENAKKASNTQVGQLKYINDYLCSHVKYDDGYCEWLDSGGNTPYDSENGVLPFNAYGALIDGSAICSGFTHAVEEICNYLKIPNFHIDNDTHAWNMVYVDNAWKMLDVTWNATGGDTSRYFLVDNITDAKSSHKYDPAKVETQKADTLAYWNLKNNCDKYFDYYTMHEAMIKKLVAMGIFQGNDSGELNMHKGLTRAELAVLLTRLCGHENEVKENSQHYVSAFPFKDVPAWAAPYVGYCYENGLLKGYNTTTFGANDAVNVKMACTVILRYLNVEDTDWKYDTAVEKAISIGMMPATWPTGTTALRNDMAIMIDYALAHKVPPPQAT